MCNRLPGLGLRVSQLGYGRGRHVGDIVCVGVQPARSSTVPAKFQEMVQSMFSPRSKRMKLNDEMQPESSRPSLTRQVYSKSDRQQQ